MKKSKLLILAISFIGLSCSNNSEDDLTNPVQLSTTKYIQNIKPIIDNNCIICHGASPTNGAPMSLVTYAQVKDAVQNRGLLDRISRTQGAPGMMPNQGTRLPQTTINLITDWNADGLLE
jgi:uncharacterized membrane protein